MESALDAGKNVRVIYTYRSIREAFHAILDRALERGCRVPVSTLIRTHAGAAQTIRHLQANYADDPRVTFRFVDKSGDPPELGTTRLA